MGVAVHLAVHGVGVHIERFDTHGVGVQPQRILARVVGGKGAAGGKATACFAVIDKFTAIQTVLVLLVNVNHMSETTVHAGMVVKVQTVAGNRLELVHHSGAAIERGTVGMRVIVAIGGGNHGTLAAHLRWAHHVGNGCACIVI